MNDFQEWLKTMPEYQTLVFQHGERLFIQRDGEFENLTVRLAYRVWGKQQVNIDQLNNMEQCYIQLKQINNEQAEIIRGHFSARQEMKKCIDAALYDIAQAKDGFYGYSSDGGDVDNLTKNIEKSLRGER